MPENENHEPESGAPDPNPLKGLDEWEEFLVERYPPGGSGVSKQAAGASIAQLAGSREFRNYEAEARDSVKEFYRLNHRYQTLDFVRAKEREFGSLDRRRMGIWDAMEFLNTLVDDSDPDTDVTQIQHLLMTAETIRREGRPRWFILAGMIHDLGKILCLYGEPQWAVVGDTFPVGCRFSDKIAYHEFFAENPDSKTAEYATPRGVYEEGCGLANIRMSWGHDEYLYRVVRDYLPDEALYMVRYHSFYPWHREGAYARFMDETDRKMLPWVKAFNPFDLYSKADEPPDTEALRPYYEELIAEFFPAEISW